MPNAYHITPAALAALRARTAALRARRKRGTSPEYEALMKFFSSKPDAEDAQFVIGSTRFQVTRDFVQDAAPQYVVSWLARNHGL